MGYFLESPGEIQILPLLGILHVYEEGNFMLISFYRIDIAH